MDARWTEVSLFTGLSGQGIYRVLNMHVLNMYAPNLKQFFLHKPKRLERAKFSYYMSVMPFGLLIAHQISSFPIETRRLFDSIFRFHLQILQKETDSHFVTCKHHRQCSGNHSDRRENDCL